MKEGDAEHSYVFAGWDKVIAAVTGDATYKATYTVSTNKYPVTWANYDRTILKTEEVAYGATPAYIGETPTREADAQYTYTFDRWTPEIAPVAGPATYTATYSTTVNKYTIKFVDEDGTTVLDQQQVEYGETPVYGGATPVKEGDAEHSYVFAGWDPVIIAVTSDATYKAKYTESSSGSSGGDPSGGGPSGGDTGGGSSGGDTGGGSSGGGGEVAPGGDTPEVDEPTITPEDEAKPVKKAIGALNSDDPDPAAVAAARDAYEKLSDEAKKSVPAETLEKLEAAEATVIANAQKAEGAETVTSKGTVTVTSTENKTVAFTAAPSSKKSVVIPSSVRIAGETFIVTEVSAGAFKNTAATTVTISKNIKKVSSKAFSGSKATKLIVKSKKLTKKSVKNSLKGSKVKTVKVKVGTWKQNKAYVKKYKKIFTKSNAGKKVTVK